MLVFQIQQQILCKQLWSIDERRSNLLGLKSMVHIPFYFGCHVSVNNVRWTWARGLVYFNKKLLTTFSYYAIISYTLITKTSQYCLQLKVQYFFQYLVTISVWSVDLLHNLLTLTNSIVSPYFVQKTVWIGLTMLALSQIYSLCSITADRAEKTCQRRQLSWGTFWIAGEHFFSKV